MAPRSTTTNIGNKQKWDVTPVLESKKYEYIPELMECVHLMRIQSAVTLRHKEVLAENHPARQQVTIAHTAPTPTVQDSIKYH